jgi:hypothetical protein
MAEKLTGWPGEDGFTEEASVTVVAVFATVT